MIVTVDNETEMQPIDVYSLFVTDDTNHMIVEESNRYLCRTGKCCSKSNT